jgi:hypothetical protein
MDYRVFSDIRLRNYLSSAKQKMLKKKTLSKEVLCQVVFRHSAKSFLPRVRPCVAVQPYCHPKHCFTRLAALFAMWSLNIGMCMGMSKMLEIALDKELLCRMFF